MGHLILVHPARRTAVTNASHLSVDDVASLIDGTIAPAERDRAERHLAECDQCREEVAACSRLLGSSTSPPVRRFPWRYLLPLAAGIVLVVMIRRPTGQERIGDVPAERGATSTGSRIVVVAPAPSSSVSQDALRFIWHPIAGSVGYRVVIKDASGAPVWSSDAADTSLALPDSVRLSPTTLYVWRVDGQRADGTSVSSAETSFRITR
jgi:hypothetical protein